MIYVVGHEYPKSDIDSVFSSILFSNFLEKYYDCKTKPIRFNKKVKKIDLILKKLNWDYPKKYKVRKRDLFVLVDHSDLNQSLNHYNISNKLWGIIDHHYYCKITDKLEFNINKKYGATATIIYEIYKEKNIEITRKLAQLFVYAIISDTKNFLLETTTKKDIAAIEDLYYRFRLKNRKSIFKEIYSFKGLNNLSCSKLLDNSYKIYNYNNYNIRISNININSKFTKEKSLIKYLSKYINSKFSDFDLFTLSFKNLETLKTKVYYFGRLSIHFRNWSYNTLKTKKKIFLKIKTKLDSL